MSCFYGDSVAASLVPTQVRLNTNNTTQTSVVFQVFGGDDFYWQHVGLWISQKHFQNEFQNDLYAHLGCGTVPSRCSGSELTLHLTLKFPFTADVERERIGPGLSFRPCTRHHFHESK